MVKFIKAQAASLTATGADFTVTVLLKEWVGFWYLLASILGTISGGIVNFKLNRSWVFSTSDHRIYFQAIKYLLVWIGNLVLVSGGVFLLTNYGGFTYLISKITVSVMIGVLYNYVLQKKFVFK
ncbi:MAG: GtrA family protein [Chitinophagaceae bacterium]|nr:GtrA family protein [Chitinophagaceae bacterium]MDP1765168.1 GtrA family protein [Sediminibacterium sp.]MDP1810473.1 GtrA family protein [Sediminibacterium sp.]MDP3129544.1 GtrA family protein [Sediminibacterium sp.]MDP3667596.1 GtrA family protein [Sediminibacterium sp.]